MAAVAPGAPPPQVSRRASGARPWGTAADAYGCIAPGTSSRRAQAIGTRPAQASNGVTAWTIFAADPARGPQIILQVKQIGIVNLPHIRFMPTRIARDLNMADQRQVRFDLLGQITAHDLTVVEVHLQEQIIAPDPLNDFASLHRGGEKIARVVTGIEGLDEQANAMGLQHFSGPAQIAHKDRLTVLLRHSRRGGTR